MSYFQLFIEPRNCFFKLVGSQDSVQIRNVFENLNSIINLTLFYGIRFFNTCYSCYSNDSENTKDQTKRNKSPENRTISIVKTRVPTSAR